MIPLRVASVPSKRTFKTKKLVEQGFRTVAENIPDLICRFSQRFTHLYVNPALSHITGVPQDAFVGRTPHEVMPRPFADFWVRHIDAVFKTKKQLTMEFVFPLPTGDRHFQSLLIPEFDANGEVVTVLTISRDITALKEEEKRKDEFLALLVTSSRRLSPA